MNEEERRKFNDALAGWRDMARLLTDSALVALDRGDMEPIADLKRVVESLAPLAAKIDAARTN